MILMKNDVSLGTGKDKRYSRPYSNMLLDYANQSLNEPELKVYNAFFNEIREKEHLLDAQDLMLLDMVCFDFVRIKRLHGFIKEMGDMIEKKFITKDGKEVTNWKANEASYLLNAVESQCRQNMKELLITKKEATKKAISMGEKDIAMWLAKPVEGETEDGD